MVYWDLITGALENADGYEFWVRDFQPTSFGYKFLKNSDFPHYKNPSKKVSSFQFFVLGTSFWSPVLENCSVF